MKATEGYEQLMIKERSMFLATFLIFVLIGPLVFRYAMGSNLIPDRAHQQLLPLNNATMSVQTDWAECIPCQDVYGITLFNVTVEVTNVTSPNPNGQTPSLAVFASQDFVNWYVIIISSLSFRL